jgi:hypothetical protein
VTRPATAWLGLRVGSPSSSVRLAAAGDEDVELLLVAAPVAVPLFDSYRRRSR